jgi:LmbE family N-acetylglucosaminyl deacetylase
MTLEHIYLSPHLDDAVLSCGGTMLRSAARGEAVHVVNVFAGSPEYGRLSEFARELHTHWGGGPDPVAARRAEDGAVLASMGATVEPWEFRDCIYRGQGETWFYASRDDLFGPVHPGDAGLLSRIALRLAELRAERPDAVFFAPLGAGHHVDHQIVRAGAVALARLGAPVVFYEDFPYTGEPAALEKAQAELGRVAWEAAVAPIDVEAKIQAIAGYVSQILDLFGDAEQMAERVRAYARSVMEAEDEHGYGERLWQMLG